MYDITHLTLPWNIVIITNLKIGYRKKLLNCIFEKKLFVLSTTINEKISIQFIMVSRQKFSCTVMIN